MIHSADFPTISLFRQYTGSQNSCCLNPETSISDVSSLTCYSNAALLLQVLMPPGDVPKLTALDRGENISHVAYNSTLANLVDRVANYDTIDAEKAIDVAFEVWMVHCDALLSDTLTIARLQVRTLQTPLCTQPCICCKETLTCFVLLDCESAY